VAILHLFVPDFQFDFFASGSPLSDSYVAAAGSPRPVMRWRGDRCGFRLCGIWWRVLERGQHNRSVCIGTVAEVEGEKLRVAAGSANNKVCRIGWQRTIIVGEEGDVILARIER